MHHQKCTHCLENCYFAIGKLLLSFAKKQHVIVGWFVQ